MQRPWECAGDCEVFRTRGALLDVVDRAVDRDPERLDGVTLARRIDGECADQLRTVCRRPCADRVGASRGG